MPLSSLSRVTCRATSPCAVNLIAFPIRLVIICRSRPGSPRNNAGTSGSIRQAISRPFLYACTASTSVMSSRVMRRSKSSVSNSNFPASILEKSRISLMIASSESPLFLMVFAYSSCSEVNSVSNSRPVMPITPFIGVRISWLMLARKSLLAMFAAWASTAS